MYQALEIDRYRGLRGLKINDLGRINLFVGPNNAGKTSVLEALWLLQNPGNPAMPLAIANARGLNVPLQSPNLVWPELFYDADLSDPISIVGVRRDSEREELILSFDHMWPEETEITSNGSPMTATFPVVNGSVVTPETLYFDYTVGSRQGARSSSSVGLGLVGLRAHSELLAQRSIYLSTHVRSSPDEMAVRYTKLSDSGSVEPLIRSLAVLQPKLRNLSIGSYRTTDSNAQAQLRVHIDGLERPLRLQSLGEGAGRLTDILLALSSLRDGVILLDEIENGFYYRSLETTWRAIDEASQTARIQVFATTHSAECVQAAVRALDGPSAADFRLYRFEPTDHGIDVVRYDHQLASSALEFELEFR